MTRSRFVAYPGDMVLVSGPGDDEQPGDEGPAKPSPDAPKPTAKKQKRWSHLL